MRVACCNTTVGDRDGATSSTRSWFRAGPTGALGGRGSCGDTVLGSSQGCIPLDVELFLSGTATPLACTAWRLKKAERRMIWRDRGGDGGIRRSSAPKERTPGPLVDRAPAPTRVRALSPNMGKAGLDWVSAPGSCREVNQQVKQTQTQPGADTHMVEGRRKRRGHGGPNPASGIALHTVSSRREA